VVPPRRVEGCSVGILKSHEEMVRGSPNAPIGKTGCGGGEPRYSHAGNRTPGKAKNPKGEGGANSSLNQG